MSDYTQITDFSVKDGYTSGNPDKIILGADFDGEFAAISTAIATKFEAADVASTAQATAGALDTVLMTPAKVNDVLAQNSGILLDISDLVDPGADRIPFWDNGVGGTWLAVTNGLEISGTNLQVAASLAGTGLSHTAGVLAVDPSEAALATIATGDKILFGDVSSSDAFSYATWANVQNSISITESQISDLGTYVSSGDTVASLNITALTMGGTATVTALETAITVNDIVEADDGILVSDNGNLEVMAWNKGGIHVETFTVDDEIDDTMYGLYMLLTGTTARTMTFNSATNAAHIGACVMLGSRDTVGLTLAASGSTTFTSFLEQGGTTSRVIPAGGSCLAIHVGSDEWMLVGNFS